MFRMKGVRRFLCRKADVLGFAYIDFCGSPCQTYWMVAAVVGDPSITGLFPEIQRGMSRSLAEAIITSKGCEVVSLCWKSKGGIDIDWVHKPNGPVRVGVKAKNALGESISVSVIGPNEAEARTLFWREFTRRGAESTHGATHLENWVYNNKIRERALAETVK